MQVPFLKISLTYNSEKNLSPPNSSEVLIAADCVTFLHSVSHGLIKSLPFLNIGSEHDVVESFECCCEIGEDGKPLFGKEELYLCDAQQGGNGVCFSLYNRFNHCYEVAQQLITKCPECVSLNKLCVVCFKLSICGSRHNLSRQVLVNWGFNNPILLD
jgi:ATP-dependent helicase YprA (DUF1998 family)